MGSDIECSKMHVLTPKNNPDGENSEVKVRRRIRGMQRWSAARLRLDI
jgi:hypothetical protein